MRKEVISLQTDPRSPDRGQYAFVQDLIKAVAYETLPKRDRKQKHLAVAAHLLETWTSDEDEIVEVVASHFLTAYQLAPSAPDAEEVKSRARELLTRAAERAAALAASEAAQRYFEQALELTDDARVRAGLEERAGQMALLSGSERASAHFESAISTLEAIGETHASARVSARLGEADFLQERLEHGVERMEAAFALLANEEPDADLATLAAQLGRLHVFTGAHELAAKRLEFALEMAETLMLPEQLSQALNTKAVLLAFQGRRQEAMALGRHALKVALENDLAAAALRAYNNLGAFLAAYDQYTETHALTEAALELARRIGERNFELWLIAVNGRLAVEAGRWDEALQTVDELRGSGELTPTSAGLLLYAVPVYVNQGRLDRARELLDALSHTKHSEEVQIRSSFAWAEAALLRAEGDLKAALAAASRSTEGRHEIGIASVKGGLVEELEAAMLTDPAKAEELVANLERLRPGESTPFLAAQAARFRARLSPAAAEQGFASALAGFQELSMPFWTAVSLLEQAEWLSEGSRGPEAVPLLEEAGRIFDELHARPWLERLARVGKLVSVSA